MVRDLKSAESETKAASILMQFNDRFDEVLAAINSTEKRLDGGSKCKSRNFQVKVFSTFSACRRGIHNFTFYSGSDVFDLPTFSGLRLAIKILFLDCNAKSFSKLGRKTLLP